MSRVTGIVLAGGRGIRMGGRDKGWVPLNGRPMIEHVLQRLGPQVDTVIISVNRHGDRYRALGHPVVADSLPGHAGPLAGIVSALSRVDTALALVVPCDAPCLPPDLAVRLQAALERDPSREIAIAHDGERMQPVFALWKSHLIHALRRDIDRGARGLGQWIRGRACEVVNFADCPETFVNVNRVVDLRALKRPPDT